MAEVDFHDLVAVWLSESFADVEHEPTLDSGRRPDFVAHTPYESYVIEVEDGFDSLYMGIGQSVVYASEIGYRPVVVFPADSVEEPELSMLQDDENSPIIETV